MHLVTFLGDTPAERSPRSYSGVREAVGTEGAIGSKGNFPSAMSADSNSELVSKADARVQEPKEGEIVRVVPRPTGLENMISDEMKQLSQLPEALNTACCCKDYKNSTVILPILP
ncbi:hypothetical protein BC332_29666 [Capsicum chinense]|nr:hypothetical protein BC332_29666 [Capsicum chinense]